NVTGVQTCALPIFSQPQLAQAQREIERAGTRAPLHAAPRFGAFALMAPALLGREQLELRLDPALGILARAGARGPGELQQPQPRPLGGGALEARANERLGARPQRTAVVGGQLRRAARVAQGQPRAG